MILVPISARVQRHSHAEGFLPCRPDTSLKRFGNLRCGRLLTSHRFQLESSVSTFVHFSVSRFESCNFISGLPL